MSFSEHENHPAHGFKLILVAIEGSENSMRTARIAVEVAQKYRGLSGFKKLVIGRVSSGVVSHAHCPVLVVR